MERKGRKSGLGVILGLGSEPLMHYTEKLSWAEHQRASNLTGNGVERTVTSPPPSPRISPL